jgi:hypothetical protein
MRPPEPHEEMPAAFEEDRESFETELLILLREISGGRRVRDLKVFLRSVKQNLCGCFPIPSQL